MGRQVSPVVAGPEGSALDCSRRTIAGVDLTVMNSSLGPTALRWIPRGSSQPLVGKSPPRKRSVRSEKRVTKFPLKERGGITLQEFHLPLPIRGGDSPTHGCARNRHSGLAHVNVTQEV